MDKSSLQLVIVLGEEGGGDKRNSSRFKKKSGKNPTVQLYEKSFHWVLVCTNQLRKLFWGQLGTLQKDLELLDIEDLLLGFLGVRMALWLHRKCPYF